MIQEHKLRGKAIESLGNSLMHGYASWILEAATGEKSWINPNAAGKGGVGILLSNKYSRLVIEHGALYEDRLVWIKLEGLEGSKIGFACVYAPNIPTDRRHMWHLMADSLPKDCEWIIRGYLNMTERAENKSHDCGRAISGLEKITWNKLLSTFQVKDSFIYQGGPRFSWCNRQKCKARRLARLDRFYLPSSGRIGMKLSRYFIHGYSVGSDHYPVQLEVTFGEEAERKSTYKWNVAHLKGEIGDKLQEMWASLSLDASFLFKFRNITRYYRQYSKFKVLESRIIELDAKAKLEVATAQLHNDIYNVELQGEVSHFKRILEKIELRKARGAMVRSRIK